MNERFLKAFDMLLVLEGGLVLHQNKTENDLTYAGIYRYSHPKWKGWEYIDKNLTPPLKLVQEFYYEKYYKKYEDLDEMLAFLLFECEVNTGSTSIKLAQKILHVKQDGIYGKITKSKLLSCETEIFAYKFQCQRVAFYRLLANKQRYSLYLKGWINRVNKVNIYLGLACL